MKFWAPVVVGLVLLTTVVAWEEVRIDQLQGEHDRLVRALFDGGLPECDCGEAARLGCRISASCMRDEMVCCEILDPSRRPE